MFVIASDLFDTAMQASIICPEHQCLAILPSLCPAIRVAHSERHGPGVRSASSDGVTWSVTFVT